jgi:hypothetical protein
MSEQETEEISNEEDFENAYRVFIMCLDALASTPEVACETYGNYNVAWEIKHDVSAGVYLAKNPAHRLSEKHIADIVKIAGMLNSLPESAIKFTNIIEESLENMRHPAWVPARQMAGQLLESLRPVTETNEKYFSK